MNSVIHTGLSSSGGNNMSGSSAASAPLSSTSGDNNNRIKPAPLNINNNNNNNNGTNRNSTNRIKPTSVPLNSAGAGPSGHVNRAAELNMRMGGGVDTINNNQVSKGEKESNNDKKKDGSSGKKLTMRFNIKIEPSTNEKFTEVNFESLIASKKTKLPPGHPDYDPLKDDNDSAEDEDEAVRRLAASFEAKYGGSSAGGSKSKKKKLKPGGKWEDYVDKGQGYDDEDSFIDNGEAYDELIPSSIDTKHGGFYVNSGKLEFKQLTDEEMAGPDADGDDDADDPDDIDSEDERIKKRMADRKRKRIEEKKKQMMMMKRGPKIKRTLTHEEKMAGISQPPVEKSTKPQLIKAPVDKSSSQPSVPKNHQHLQQKSSNMSVKTNSSKPSSEHQMVKNLINIKQEPNMKQQGPPKDNPSKSLLNRHSVSSLLNRDSSPSNQHVSAAAQLIKMSGMDSKPNTGGLASFPPNAHSSGVRGSTSSTSSSDRHQPTADMDNYLSLVIKKSLENNNQAQNNYNKFNEFIQSQQQQQPPAAHQNSSSSSSHNAHHHNQNRPKYAIPPPPLTPSPHGIKPLHNPALPHMTASVHSRQPAIPGFPVPKPHKSSLSQSSRDGNVQQKKSSSSSQMHQRPSSSSAGHQSNRPSDGNQKRSSSSAATDVQKLNQTMTPSHAIDAIIYSSLNKAPDNLQSSADYHRNLNVHRSDPSSSERHKSSGVSLSSTKPPDEKDVPHTKVHKYKEHHRITNLPTTLSAASGSGSGHPTPSSSSSKSSQQRSSSSTPSKQDQRPSSASPSTPSSIFSPQNLQPNIPWSMPQNMMWPLGQLMPHGMIDMFREQHKHQQQQLQREQQKRISESQKITSSTSSQPRSSPTTGLNRSGSSASPTTGLNASSQSMLANGVQASSGPGSTSSGTHRQSSPHIHVPVPRRSTPTDVSHPMISSSQMQPASPPVVSSKGSSVPSQPIVVPTPISASSPRLTPSSSSPSILDVHSYAAPNPTGENNNKSS